MNKQTPATVGPRDCFVICPIGENGSEVRLRADMLLKHVLAPALSSCNYRPIRADQVPKAGLITSQIINLVIDAPLVIADLTGGNPNVFYELAIRHATGKPYIQLIEKGNNIPFDVGGVRTIVVDSKNLDSVDECKAHIRSYILEFDAGHQADSPVILASKVRLLQSDPELAQKLLEKLEEMHGGGWKSIDDLGEQLEEVQRTLESIEAKLEND